MKKETHADIACIASALLFAIAAVLVKLVSGGFDGVFISFIRFVTGIALAVILIRCTKSSFTVSNRGDLLLRSLWGAASMILYFVSIQYSGSGRATLFNNAYPAFVVLFGSLFFGEKARFVQLASVALCVAGSALAFYNPGGPGTLFGDALGLASAVCAGISVHYIKRARVGNSSFMVYGAVCLTGLPLTFPSLNQLPHLTLPSLGLMVLAASVIFAAQVLLTWGLKYISASRGSILSFLKVPVTIALGLLIGEKLTAPFIAGTALVMTGLALNRE